MKKPLPTRANGKSARMIDFSPIARRYANARVWSLNRQSPNIIQSRLLIRLVRRAAKTKFGKTHSFDQITQIEEFQKRVPVRHYDEFWQDWWKGGYPDLINETWPGRIPFFTMTSGTTTGRSKFIPYTTEMRRSAARGFLDLLCHHFVHRPDSRLLGGSALGLTGPAQLQHAMPGVDVGSVSAITAGALPSWFADRVLPPPDIAGIADWEEKIRRLAPLSLQQDVRFLGGSPNWLLIFMEELAQTQQRLNGRLVDWYPNLELIVHGGVNFAPYRHRFSDLMQGGHAETREMYSASEGVFAYADRGDGEGMRLHLNGQVFFEFIPAEQVHSENPDRHWVGNIETEVDYALIVSTAAGLWSYLVGDIVRFVDTSPPRLFVVGRVENGLSAFGEHLIEAEIADAVAFAASQAGLSVLDYCVGPIREIRGNRHLFLIEVEGAPEPETAKNFADIIDRVLSERNEDYSELRGSGLAISAPEVKFVPSGGFLRWMKARRNLGGQYKVPRIIIDGSLFEDLLATVLGSAAKGQNHDS
ncbi:GH3 family domain-containing protein [Ruegeria arenilitoris]|uniref:GH3 family domain-containing protein n=1 Tax=Ruegeria arenilitoris TaxID=1173585 RepID=UPI00147D0000|nr:GH3 auxin-responsive promoter family protein [Ruegeria arenilitoris]